MLLLRIEHLHQLSSSEFSLIFHRHVATKPVLLIEGSTGSLKRDLIPIAMVICLYRSLVHNNSKSVMKYACDIHKTKDEKCSVEHWTVETVIVCKAFSVEDCALKSTTTTSWSLPNMTLESYV